MSICYTVSGNFIGTKNVAGHNLPTGPSIMSSHLSGDTESRGAIKEIISNSDNYWTSNKIGGGAAGLD